MQTNREKILEYLRQHPEGADDDQLSEALSIRPRQQVNIICRRLANEGLIERVHGQGKIRNYWKGSPKATGVHIRRDETIKAEDKPRAILNTENRYQAWDWEGNVQKKVIEHLERERYRIVRAADTRTRERGRDIEAERDGTHLWVTVKGYPKGTPRTPAPTQAGHWFKDALYDIISWRGEDVGAGLVMALPDYPRYRNLATKVSWLQSDARFSFFWIQKDGSMVKT